jgi:hypothetical protein
MAVSFTSRYRSSGDTHKGGLPSLDGYGRLLNPIDRVWAILLGLMVTATLLFLGGRALGSYAAHTRPAQPAW